MVALDTTLAAAAVQEAAHRRLGPSGRFKVAVELSNLTRAFATAGLRRRHPEYSDARIREKLAHEMFRLKIRPR